MMQQYKIWVRFLFIIRDSVSHLYKIVGRIIILYILIFKFLDGRLEDYMKHVEREGSIAVTYMLIKQLVFM